MSSGTNQQQLSAHMRTASTGSSEWEYLDEERQSVSSFGSAEDREALIIFDNVPRRIQPQVQQIHNQQAQQQQHQQYAPSSPSSGLSIGLTSSQGIDATGLALGVTSAASEAMHLGSGYYCGLESASLASGDLSDDISLEQRLLEKIERLSHELSESHERAKLLKFQNEQLGGENGKLKDMIDQFHQHGNSLDSMLINALSTNKTGVAAMASVCVLAALFRKRAGLGPVAIAGMLASVVLWLNADDSNGNTPHSIRGGEGGVRGMGGMQVKQLAKEEFARRQLIDTQAQ